MSNTIFLNGQFVKQEEAKISITTHALHYGTGCFEGIRAYYNEKENCLYAFRMKEHYQRLLLSSKILFISIPYSVEELCKITIKLLQQNFQETDLYIRPLAYKADPAVGNFNLRSLKDGFFIYSVPLGRHLDTKKGIRANVSSWMRVPDNAIPPRAKITGSYVNTTLAKTESILSGYEEALFLDREGHIVEGSAENLFIVKNGGIITPPVSDDILLGITRDTVITICQNELKRPVAERSIDRSEIYQAEEVLIVGTGAEISPVVEIDGRIIGSGAVGPITSKVKQIYFNLVHGEYPKYKDFVIKVMAKK